MFYERRTTPRPTFLIAVAAGCFALAVLPETAVAADKKLQSVLGEIEWGDTKETVLEKLKSQMLRKVRQREDLKHNRVKMQQARKEALDKYRDIENSWTELEGEDSGYRVSVVTGEFTRDNGEALLKAEDDAAQRFYFFKDGKFYKLVVAYRQTYLDGVSFKPFVAQVAKKYGKPDDTETKTVGDDTKMGRAIWKSSSTILTVKDQKELFGTYSLVFSDRKRVKKMKANNEDFGGSEKDSSELSSRVNDLKEETSNENEQVVDEMVNEDIEVDMDKNARLEDEEEEGEDSETSDGKNEKKEDGGDKVADKESSDDSSDDDQQGGGSQQQNDRDFDNLSADDEQEGSDDEGDGGVIVY